MSTVEGYRTVKEVAALYGVAERTVNQWCLAGLFPGAIKIGAARGTWFIPDAALQNFQRPAKGRRRDK